MREACLERFLSHREWPKVIAGGRRLQIDHRHIPCGQDGVAVVHIRHHRIDVVVHILVRSDAVVGIVDFAVRVAVWPMHPRFRFEFR